MHRADPVLCEGQPISNQEICDKVLPDDTISRQPDVRFSADSFARRFN
jgi:hypothetical protein